MRRDATGGAGGTAQVLRDQKRRPKWGQSPDGLAIRLEVDYTSITEPEAVDEVDVHALVLDDEWELTARYRRTDEGPILEHLQLRPATKDADILGSKLLRRLRLGAVVDEFAELLKDPLVQSYLGEEWHQRPVRPGRAGTDDLFYAQWAQRYVDALAVAPDRPIEHLVESADEHLTPAQVRAYLNKARSDSRQLLTKAPPGKAGGELTDRARELLDAWASRARATGLLKLDTPAKKTETRRKS